MKAEILESILDARKNRRSIAVVTELGDNAQRVVLRSGADDALDKRFRFDQSGIEKSEAGESFVAIHNPPLRLIIIGAVHIAQSIIPMAQAANYDVTVIDPRGAFATGARFPGVSLVEDWPQDVLMKSR